MKKKIFRWLKFIGLLAAAAVCLCMILLELIFVVPEYGAWQFNASVKQLYEDMDSFFIGVSFLILCSGFFLISVSGIVHLFRKSERAPSPLWRRSRNYILFISLILFAVSMLWDRDVTAKMDAIIEDGEVPMAYRLHLLHGWLSIVQMLTFWGFLVPLYSWSKEQEAAWAKTAAEKTKNPPVGDFGKEENTMGLLGKLFNNKNAVQDRLLLHRLGSMELVNYGTAQIKLEKVEWVCKGPGAEKRVREPKEINKVYDRGEPLRVAGKSYSSFAHFWVENIGYSNEKLGKKRILLVRKPIGSSQYSQDWIVIRDGEKISCIFSDYNSTDVYVTDDAQYIEPGVLNKMQAEGFAEFMPEERQVVREQPEIPQAPIAEHPPLTQWETFGGGEPIYFIDESRGIQKLIVDSNGNIRNFPGFSQEDLWVSQVDPCYLKPLIRFCTSFERRGGRLIMLWEIQPDGRYWEDEDGFGGTSDAEVTLYTFLDENGDFTGPFRVYRIGAHDYYKPEV